MKLLFVEMGVGYDQHGQDITAAAMRACRDAISSNSIPAFRRDEATDQARSASFSTTLFGCRKSQISLSLVSIFMCSNFLFLKHDQAIVTFAAESLIQSFGQQLSQAYKLKLNAVVKFWRLKLWMVD